jgi:hypothetical protein
MDREDGRDIREFLDKQQAFVRSTMVLPLMEREVLNTEDVTNDSQVRTEKHHETVANAKRIISITNSCKDKTQKRSKNSKDHILVVRDESEVEPNVKEETQKLIWELLGAFGHTMPRHVTAVAAVPSTISSGDAQGSQDEAGLRLTKDRDSDLNRNGCDSEVGDDTPTNDDDTENKENLPVTPLSPTPKTTVSASPGTFSDKTCKCAKFADK